jgi:hypothetical protein
MVNAMAVNAGKMGDRMADTATAKFIGVGRSAAKNEDD